MEHYMAAWRYEISLVKYFSTLEEKFCISARPCNTLYVSITYTLGTHSLTVLSLDAEAIKCPDGENFTESTAS